MFDSYIAILSHLPIFVSWFLILSLWHSSDSFLLHWICTTAQALVHAHTQAQIAAGIYKGDETPKETAGTTAAPAAQQVKISAPVKATSTGVPNPVMGSPGLAARPPVANPSTSVNGASHSSAMVTSSNSKSNGISVDDHLIPQAAAPSSSSPQFLAQLNVSLDKFWRKQLQAVQELKRQTEQDFKTHNDLPLARIKRIMKSDEDVRMISAEAPVLFAKACELFILDLSIRSWNYSQLHKRRTLQKEDIREAIQKTDIFDFLVDVIWNPVGNRGDWDSIESNVSGSRHYCIFFLFKG